MQLDTDMFIDLVFKAIEMDVEEKIWDKWLAELPNMSEETFVPFEKYKEEHFQPQEAEKDDDEILKDAEEILKMMNKPK
ncbi:hypothetical protein M3210_03035 [Oceanobacillus luteolus]|nr:hypothetical protein [Oceanobacillus luteolus]